MDARWQNAIDERAMEQKLTESYLDWLSMERWAESVWSSGKA